MRFELERRPPEPAHQPAAGHDTLVCLVVAVVARREGAARNVVTE